MDNAFTGPPRQPAPQPLSPSSTASDSSTCVPSLSCINSPSSNPEPSNAKAYSGPRVGWTGSRRGSSHEVAIASNEDFDPPPPVPELKHEMKYRKSSQSPGNADGAARSSWQFQTPAFGRPVTASPAQSRLDRNIHSQSHSQMASISDMRFATIMKKMTEYCQDATGKCSACSAMFRNAQAFLDHLGECVLQQIDSSKDVTHYHTTSTSKKALVKRMIDKVEAADTSRVSINGVNKQMDGDKDENKNFEDFLACNDRDDQVSTTSTHANSETRPLTDSSSAVIESGQPMWERMLLSGSGPEKGEHYLLSWEISADKMRMKKRVICVDDDEGRSWIDHVMRDNLDRNIISENDIYERQLWTDKDMLDISNSKINKQDSNPNQDQSVDSTTDLDFPSLGFKSTNVDSLDADQATPKNGDPSRRHLITRATDAGASPTDSDLSSSEKVKNQQDVVALGFIDVSSTFLVSAYLKLATKHTSYEHGDGAVVNDSSTCKTSSKQTQRTQDSSNGRKRKLNRSHSGSDDFDDNEDPKRQKTRFAQPNQENSDILPLACPFNKYDSILFGPDSPEEAYHACATCSFVSIAHLKQHLQRNHYKPKYYCFSCCTRFTSQAMTESHMRQRPPCDPVDPPLYRERIGPDVIEELGLDRRNLPGTGRVAYWYRLYDAFFPNATNRSSVSPYYEGPAAQNMSRFLNFSRPAIRDLLPKVQQRLGLEEVLPSHDLVRLGEEILQEATQLYLSQIGQANSFTAIGSMGILQPSSSSSASTTLDSTTQSSPNPPTSVSTIAPRQVQDNSTTAGGPSNDNLPVEVAKNGEDLLPFDTYIPYDPGHDWSAELDSMGGFDLESDWNLLCPEASDLAGIIAPSDDKQSYLQ
ncbi:MAG: hypothetical protein Q9227_009069 [Pyrenula ochraceoflavens]